MQYTKPMIELVFEIRKLVPSPLKPGIKLANPDLFAELREHYKTGAKTITKALIKELFSLAGEEWLIYLTQAAPDKPIYNTKMYRGVVSLEESATNTGTDTNAKKKDAKKRVYRGQVIA